MILPPRINNKAFVVFGMHRLIQEKSHLFLQSCIAYIDLLANVLRVLGESAPAKLSDCAFTPGREKDKDKKPHNAYLSRGIRYCYH
jgi:hypothetical protein